MSMFLLEGSAVLAMKLAAEILGVSTSPDLVLVNSPLKDYGAQPKRNNFTLPTLGLGYIATCAAAQGFTVGLLDAEALGLSLEAVVDIVNRAAPRWVGMNLLAPTYKNSISILSGLSPDIQIMLGGHQAKAMPKPILANQKIPRIDALILGEAESRVPQLLAELNSREFLPMIYWRRDRSGASISQGSGPATWLAPDLNVMPFIDRRFLPQDPYWDGEVLESAMVASRGCPFDCSFCGAAVSANPDVSIRTRKPINIVQEILILKNENGVRRVRFVDDLFLSNRKVMKETLGAFVSERIDMKWDATGRINVLANCADDLIGLMRESGCREVALGIETGSDRLLTHIDKKITTAQTEIVVRRLCAAGINIKGYFILGLPTETRIEHDLTLTFIQKLWDVTANYPGQFRCSVFEYRPYPGTPDWHRLVAAGYSETEMLNYDSDHSVDASILDRDEFNFSTGLQFGEVSVGDVRRSVSDIMIKQKQQ